MSQKALPAERTGSPSLSEERYQADSLYVLFWNLAVLPQAHDSRCLKQVCVPMGTIEARRKITCSAVGGKVQVFVRRPQVFILLGTFRRATHT